jgi:hypothetical protein
VPNPDLRLNTNSWGLHQDGIRVLQSDIGEGLMIRILDGATQQTIINTGGFRVTPGKPFRATMRLRVTRATVGHAYFTVTWLNAATEVARERLDLEPSPIRLPSTRTMSNGAFRAVFRDLTAGRYRVRVEYTGDSSRLPAAWEKNVLIT